MMKNMKYMIWDFDGTLVDTYPVMTKSLLKALEENNIHTSYLEVYKALKQSLSEAIESYAGGHSALSQKIRTRFAELEALEDPCAYSVFPDSLEVLKTLSDQGVKHFVLTHRNASTHNIMKACGMDAYIVDTVISDDGFKRKPHPEAFLHLIHKHGLNKENTLSIGDRQFDIQAGKNAGIAGCLILDAYNIHLQSFADICVHNRMDILDLFMDDGKKS